MALTVSLLLDVVVGWSFSDTTENAVINEHSFTDYFTTSLVFLG